MAKSISSELMETMLTKIMEKVADTFQTAIGQLVAAVMDTMNNKISVIASRLDNIELQLTQIKSVTPELGIRSTNPASGIEDVSRALMAVEKEKEEIRIRARNVIITGLPTAPNNCTDIELVETLCEQHLTVKPRVLRARRLGKDKIKMCVTLESSEAVDDLIESSYILRQSSDTTVQRIYINRDLTLQQADVAYKNRCEMREKRRLSGVPLDSGITLNPNATSFQRV